jgi:hypothetical protein
MSDAILALEDGTWFQGVAAGANGEARGEVVFNTSMTGYQEVLTDPSYSGQIVTMTCPEIGNYGVSSQDVESRAPQVAGFIVREASPISSNWRAESTLREYLVANKIVAIADIDTRALTRKLRSGGVLRGVIATGAALDPKALVERAQAVPNMEGSDLVRDVTCRKAFDWPLALAGKRGSQHEPSRKRLWRSLVYLTLLPIFLFVLLLLLLTLARPPKGLFSSVVALVLAVVSAHAAFAPYRLWLASMEAKPDIFYYAVPCRLGYYTTQPDGLEPFPLDQQWAHANYCVAWWYVAIALLAALANLGLSCVL